jgi:hypothetical protein
LDEEYGTYVLQRLYAGTDWEMPRPIITLYYKTASQKHRELGRSFPGVKDRRYESQKIHSQGSLRAQCSYVVYAHSRIIVQNRLNPEMENPKTLQTAEAKPAQKGVCAEFVSLQGHRMRTRVASLNSVQHSTCFEHGAYSNCLAAIASAPW